MRLVMSLWTGAAGFEFTKANAILFSLAVASARELFPDSEFVGDIDGVEIADRLGWQFTSYSRGLESFCPDNARHVWMLGKIEASRIQAVPHITLDMDFVALAIPERVLGARVAVQSKEELRFTYGREAFEVSDLYGIERDTIAYNCGLVVWNDLELRDEYCNRAMQTGLGSAIMSSNGTMLSILAEQTMLGQVLRERRVRPEECIPLPSLSHKDDFSDVKFIHFRGRSKNTEEWVGKTEARFRERFPEDAKRFDLGFPKLLEKGMAIP